MSSTLTHNLSVALTAYALHDQISEGPFLKRWQVTLPPDVDKSDPSVDLLVNCFRTADGFSIYVSSEETGDAVVVEAIGSSTLPAGFRATLNTAFRDKPIIAPFNSELARRWRDPSLYVLHDEAKWVGFLEDQKTLGETERELLLTLPNEVMKWAPNADSCSVRSNRAFSGLKKDVEPMLKILRQLGFKAQQRDLGENHYLDVAVYW